MHLYKYAKYLRLQIQFSFIEVIIKGMQEQIKLFILLILSLCTYLKVKNGWKGQTTTRITKRQYIVDHLEPISNSQAEDYDEQQLRRLAQQMVRNDNIYIKPNPEAISNIKESRLDNVTKSKRKIFCKPLQIPYQSDSLVLYNQAHFQPCIFIKREVLTNEEHLRNIEHLMTDKYYNQIIIEPMNIQESSSHESIKRGLLLRKKRMIFKKNKPRKMRDRSLNSQQKTMISETESEAYRQPSKKKKINILKNSRSKYLDIDEQIKKRQLQIDLLRKMKRQRFI